jgi:enamine deaminase RidA (YjgF/YER057c/UK114 family)
MKWTARWSFPTVRGMAERRAILSGRPSRSGSATPARWSTAAGCTSRARPVRVRYLLPEREDFEPCRPVLRKAFADVRPAATMLQCGLADPRMKIEIEVDAHLPS